MATHSLQSTSFSAEVSFVLQLQFSPRPKLMCVTGAARGRIPRELMDRCNQLELQLFIPAEFNVTHYSYRIGPFFNSFEKTMSSPMAQ